MKGEDAWESKKNIPNIYKSHFHFVIWHLQGVSFFGGKVGRASLGQIK